jgi:hypothetical protein
VDIFAGGEFIEGNDFRQRCGRELLDAAMNVSQTP